MKKFIFIILTSIASTVIMNAETKTSIKPSELHPLILNDIQKNYPGYSIYEAFKVNTRGVISYEVIVQKNNETFLLFYDDKGTFLRKKTPKLNKSVPHQQHK